MLAVPVDEFVARLRSGNESREDTDQSLSSNHADLHMRWRSDVQSSGGLESLGRWLLLLHQPRNDRFRRPNARWTKCRVRHPGGTQSVRLLALHTRRDGPDRHVLQPRPGGGGTRGQGLR